MYTVYGTVLYPRAGSANKLDMAKVTRKPTRVYHFFCFLPTAPVFDPGLNTILSAFFYSKTTQIRM